mgnify:CR=1 FL=1
MIGLQQFETWGDVSMSRYDAASDLGEALQNIPGLKVIADPPSQAPVWLYRPILITEEFGMSRDAAVAVETAKTFMARKHNQAASA